MKYIFFLLPLLIFPLLTSAQDFTPLVSVPFIGETNSIEDFIQSLYFLAISVAAFLAVVMIILGGVKYMLSDVVTDKSDAKKDIKGALLGLLIVLAAVLMLETINPQLTNLNVLGNAESGSFSSESYSSYGSSNASVVQTGDSYPVDGADAEQFIENCTTDNGLFDSPGEIKIQSTPAGDRLYCDDANVYDPNYGEMSDMSDYYLYCETQSPDGQSSDYCVYEQYATERCVNGYVVWESENYGTCEDVESGVLIDLESLEEATASDLLGVGLLPGEIDAYIELVAEQFIANCPGVVSQSDTHLGCDVTAPENTIDTIPTTPTPLTYEECLVGGGSYTGYGQCDMEPEECSNVNGVIINDSCEKLPPPEAVTTVSIPLTYEECLSGDGRYNTATDGCIMTENQCDSINGTVNDSGECEKPPTANYLQGEYPTECGEDGINCSDVTFEDEKMVIENGLSELDELTFYCDPVNTQCIEYCQSQVEIREGSSYREDGLCHLAALEETVTEVTPDAEGIQIEEEGEVVYFTVDVDTGGQYKQGDADITLIEPAWDDRNDNGVLQVGIGSGNAFNSTIDGSGNILYVGDVLEIDGYIVEYGDGSQVYVPCDDISPLPDGCF